MKRTSHPEDGRAVVLQLSPRGQARLEDVRSSRRQLMADLTHDWAPGERETFCALLTRFNVALSARMAAPDAPGGAPQDTPGVSGGVSGLSEPGSPGGAKAPQAG